MMMELLALVAGVTTVFATPTTPTGSVTYFVNPLDSRYLSVTRENDTTTVSGLRDVNGLPVGVYAMQSYSDNATMDADEVLSQYVGSVVTTFEEVVKANTTTLRVKKVIVDGVTFDFQHMLLENATMMRVAITSGTFKINTDLLPVPTVERTFEALASEPLHDLSPYLNGTAASVVTYYADARGSPLLDGDVVFVVEKEDDDNTTTLLAARNEGSGSYGTTLPFYPAPVALPGWVDLITTGTDLEVGYACNVLDAYDATVCDDVALRLANVTSDEALDVVRVCPVVFSSWARSCESSLNVVKIEDSASPAASTVTPYGRALNGSFIPGTPIKIPESVGVALDGTTFFQQIPREYSQTAGTRAFTLTNDMTGGGAEMDCGFDRCICQAPSGNVCPVTDPDPPIPRTFNGCGTGGLSANDIIPPAFQSGFITACNGHDLCYSECGASRLSCDSDFLDDMVGVCNSNFLFLLITGQYPLCLAFANAFYFAVFLGGAGPYAGGQMDFCTCENCT